MKTIALLGKSGSGKDEVAKILSKHYGLPRIHPIADLKNFIEDLDGLPRGYLDTEGRFEVIRHSPSITELSQFLCSHYGTEPEWKVIGAFFYAFRKAVMMRQSYQELMVSLYHDVCQYEPLFTRPYILREMQCHVASGKGFCILGVRKMHEVEDYVTTCLKNNNQPIVLEIIRDASRQETSDDQYDKILTHIDSVCGFITVTNHGSLRHLERSVIDAIENRFEIIAGLKGC